MYFSVFLCLLVSSIGSSLSAKPGPKFPPTKGEVWPKPQKEQREKTYYTVDAGELKITATKETCKVVENAIERYRHIIKQLIQQNKITHKREVKDDSLGQIDLLNLVLSKPCEKYPYFNMDESYSLTISSTSQIVSSSVWGILRGLETFTQLLYCSEETIRINKNLIEDAPAYAHRGLLLDTSRHFISMTNILLILDAMEMNKMNVFHWHIVDDQSFPYQSKRFPELSEKGAYHRVYQYSPQDVQKVIDYATDRGIRVLPEFDVPGHTRSWGESHPELLTKCIGRSTALGPMNPILNSTYEFLKELFKEVKHVFPDQYLHLGGDEVEMSCWKGNPDLQAYMKEHNMTSPNELHALFMQKVLSVLDESTKSIVWQEVFDENVKLPKDTLVQFWKSNCEASIRKAIEEKYDVLISHCWYLDHLKTGGDWEGFYRCKPRDLVSEPENKKKIIGGEACMWAEVVDDANVISRIWPRASATAERVWSDVESHRNLRNRMEEHACRMKNRGINAQPPNGPGFCPPSNK